MGERLRGARQSAKRDDVTIAAAAGLVAGAAYVAVLAADLRLTGRNVDDLAALDRFVVDKDRPARVIGLGIHLINSVGLALVYTRVREKLPGPRWMRGVLFALAENTSSIRQLS